MLEVGNKEYKVKGFGNRWSVIDTQGDYALLENCTWGDETFYLIVRRDVVVENVLFKRKGTSVVLPQIKTALCETFDDLETALADFCLN